MGPGQEPDPWHLQDPDQESPKNKKCWHNKRNVKRSPDSISQVCDICDLTSKNRAHELVVHQQASNQNLQPKKGS